MRRSKLSEMERVKWADFTMLIHDAETEMGAR